MVTGNGGRIFHQEEYDIARKAKAHCKDCMHFNDEKKVCNGSGVYIVNTLDFCAGFEGTTETGELLLD